MEEVFDNWNSKKKDIHLNKIHHFYHKREIWWCSLGINIGAEHNGDNIEFQRPILILKALSARTCLVIPLTSSEHEHPMRVIIGQIDGKEAKAVISQIRVIDTKRLTEKICFLDKATFETIRKAVKGML